MTDEKERTGRKTAPRSHPPDDERRMETGQRRDQKESPCVQP